MSGLSEEGRVWVLRAADNKIAASISVGPSPSGIEMSPDGRRAYVSVSGANSLLAIDTVARRIAGHTRTGRHPGAARLTPDGRTLLVPNRDDGGSVIDVTSLQTLATISVVAHPDQIAVLPDSSLAFVSSSGANQLSAVDLRRRVLLTNIELDGAAGQLILKPDGGELYVPPCLPRMAYRS